MYITVTAAPRAARNISEKLYGIFLEDINYGGDGGLYAAAACPTVRLNLKGRTARTIG